MRSNCIIDFCGPFPRRGKLYIFLKSIYIHACAKLYICQLSVVCKTAKLIKMD